MVEFEIPPLVIYGQPKLMQPQQAVSKEVLESRSFQKGLQVLAACMDHYLGIGIAAPQIGWYCRVFCMGVAGQADRYPDAAQIPFEFWVNPKIVWRSSWENWAWEGCLSVPGMRGWVSRPGEVKVEGLDESGQFKSKHYEGFTARVFQHEFDHLDGILFPVRVKDPKHLLPNESLAEQGEWPEDWPSPGARHTRPGQLSLDE